MLTKNGLVELPKVKSRVAYRLNELLRDEEKDRYENDF